MKIIDSADEIIQLSLLTEKSITTSAEVAVEHTKDLEDSDQDRISELATSIVCFLNSNLWDMFEISLSEVKKELLRERLNLLAIDKIQALYKLLDYDVCPLQPSRRESIRKHSLQMSKLATLPLETESYLDVFFACLKSNSSSVLLHMESFAVEDVIEKLMTYMHLYYAWNEQNKKTLPYKRKRVEASELDYRYSDKKYAWEERLFIADSHFASLRR